MDRIRLAAAEDNPGLLALTKATPMPGAIGLRIDRDPDFFRLLSLRGEGRVLVEESEGEIRGCISISRRPVWAAGSRRTLWYVGDLKVHPRHRKPGVGARLALAALEHLRDRGADLLTCVVAEGNHQALPFLEGRLELPAFRSLGRLRVHLTFSAPGSPSPRYRVLEARPADARELEALFSETMRQYELAPVLLEEEWRRAMALDPDVCLVLKVLKEGEIRAAGWLFDVAWAKRHVVTSLPLGISALAGPLRPLGRLSPAFRIPRAGEAVSLLCLRHLAVKQGDQGALAALIREARRRAYRRDVPFLIYGVHQRDPLRSVFRRIPHLTMGSELFLASLRGDAGLVEAVARGIPVEDYAVA